MSIEDRVRGGRAAGELFALIADEYAKLSNDEQRSRFSEVLSENLFLHIIEPPKSSPVESLPMSDVEVSCFGLILFPYSTEHYAKKLKDVPRTFLASWLDRVAPFARELRRYLNNPEVSRQKEMEDR